MGLEIWSHLDAWLPYKCTGHVKTWLNAPVSTFTCGCLGNHTFLGKLLQKWATATVALRNRKVPTKVNNSHKELRFSLYNSLISFPSSHIILSHLLSSSHTLHTSLYHQLKCLFLYKAIPSSPLDLIAFFPHKPSDRPSDLSPILRRKATQNYLLRSIEHTQNDCY